MRAVNLIPPEERRGSAGAPGRAGNAVYILLGVLGVCVIAAAAFALTSNSIKNRRGKVATATAEASGMEAQATALKPYADFASLGAKRASTVQSLADSRFDWERVLRDLSIVLPTMRGSPRWWAPSHRACPSPPAAAVAVPTAPPRCARASRRRPSSSSAARSIRLRSRG